MPVSPPREAAATPPNNRFGSNSSNKNMHRRHHNSCVDFTFCSDKAANGSKLVKLNTLFERIADRECGGIREEKLCKLIPSSPSNSIKYGHLQRKKRRGVTIVRKNGAATDDLHLISRGPFLAMFAHESTTFFSTLATNEKSEREGKRQPSRKKSSKTQKCSEKDTSSKRNSSDRKERKMQDASNPPANEELDMVIPTDTEPDQRAAFRCRANTAPTGSAEFMQLLKDSSDDGSSSLEMYSYEDSSSNDDESTAWNTINLVVNDSANLSSSPPLSDSEHLCSFQQQQLSPKSRRLYRRSASNSDQSQSSIKSDGDLNYQRQSNSFSLNRPRSSSMSSHSDASVDSLGSNQIFDSSNQFCPFSPSHNPYGGSHLNQNQMQNVQVVHRNSPSKPGHRRTPTPIIGDKIDCYENILPDNDPMKFNSVTSPSLTKTLTSDGQDSSNYGDSWDLSSYSMSSGEDDESHVYYDTFGNVAISPFKLEDTHSVRFNPEMHNFVQSQPGRTSSEKRRDDVCSSCSFLLNASKMIRQTFPFLFKESSVSMVQEYNKTSRNNMIHPLPVQYSFPMYHEGFQSRYFAQNMEHPHNLYPSPVSSMIPLTLEQIAQHENQIKYEYHQC
jgi:hypothetical protein